MDALTLDVLTHLLVPVKGALAIRECLEDEDFVNYWRAMAASVCDIIFWRKIGPTIRAATCREFLSMVLPETFRLRYSRKSPQPQ